MLPAAPLPCVSSHTTSPAVRHAGALAARALGDAPAALATDTAAATSAQPASAARTRRVLLPLRCISHPLLDDLTVGGIMPRAAPFGAAALDQTSASLRIAPRQPMRIWSTPHG